MPARSICISVTWLILIGLVPFPAAGIVTAHRITSGGDLLTGEMADGQIGDYLMANDSVTVVISDIPHGGLGAESGGNIIDAATNGTRGDALGNLYTYFDDDWPRQAAYHDLAILDDGSTGGPAAIRVWGEDTENPALEVVTDYILAADDKYVTVSTTVTNTGGANYPSFELGDAFHWGDCAKFVPGYGFNVPSETSEPWLAGTAEVVSYGCVSPPETMWGPHGSYWSDVNVMTAQLGPGSAITYTRQFLIGGRDIASVAILAHEIMGIETGSLLCTVADQLSGAPLEGATIDAFYSGGVIYLQMESDAVGRAAATLTPGDWRLLAGVPGYESIEAWVTLSGGDTTTHHFNLIPDSSIPVIGDTLTVIQRPLLNIPAIVTVGDTLTIECEADAGTSEWAAELRRGVHQIPLEILNAAYDAGALWWRIEARIPEPPLYELYDLRVTAAGSIDDVTRQAVKVIPAFKDDYYFAHITDPHLPTHLYYDEAGAEADSSEMLDLRAVIADLEIINPEFVLLTGDLVNEGELEDFLYRRYYTRSQRLLGEFTVPVYLTSGNHDIGGWDATPPSDGTARRTWWRFFGWERLDDPPPGAPWYTQNYSFDYGPVHYVGLEAYNNYDMWRSGIYGSDSFTAGQLTWLGDDLAGAAGSASQVLFYHCDFSGQINLNSLGVEMALWGHIHRDEGSISQPPYDLSTDNTCDGDRAFRLVRVSNGELQPRPTLSAGAAGENLTISYFPANNGQHDTVTATVTNNFDEEFEQALLRFLMPNDPGELTVAGGTLEQIDTADSVAVSYVHVEIQPHGIQEITVSREPACIPPDCPPEGIHLRGGYPNPSGAGATLTYALPRAAQVRLAIHDSLGRVVTVLVDGPERVGEWEVNWDGCDPQGRRNSPGVYFAHLKVDDTVRVRKIILAH